jgi:hypothetical protein
MAKIAKAGGIRGVVGVMKTSCPLYLHPITPSAHPHTTPNPPKSTIQSNFVLSMFYGYRILAAMMEIIIGNSELLGQISRLDADLVIGDAVGSYGHWISGLTGIPAVEFDVGTSSGESDDVIVNVLRMQFVGAFCVDASKRSPSQSNPAVPSTHHNALFQACCTRACLAGS